MKKGSEFESRKMVTHKRPCFFKILFPDLTKEHLRIPPKFKKHIREDLTHRGLLRVPSGGIWHVRLRKVANDIFLKDGWAEFVRDNSLGYCEFLLFTYDGCLSFNVQIFDANGLERVNQQPVAPESDQAQPNQLRQPRALKISTAESCSEEKILLDKIDQRSEETNVRCEKGKQKAIERKTGRDRKKPVLPETRHCSSKKKSPCEEEIAPDQKASKSFTSEFPYFEGCMKLYNVQNQHFLSIPIAFARKYFPAKKTKVILRNQEEESWEVTYMSYKTNRAFMGGWKAFVCDNKLKENDICIFELVGENEMKVYIFRSGSHP